MTKLITIILALGLSAPSFATVIAIVDSGTDLNHKELSNKKWTNPKDVDDAVDNDDNGYIDDVNGWNFADNNNKLIDKKYLGTFSQDVYKFFEVQTRMLRGEGTQADRDWIEAARNNPKLLSELQTFGNFVHGTHVAGIAAKNNDHAQIMGLKIIPTKSPIGGSGKLLPQTASTPDLVETALKALASQQGKSLAPIGTYLAKGKARVVNCSFGTSTAAAKMILGPILKLLLRHDATQEELDRYSKFFVGEVVKQASALVEPSKGKALFVIAAGNDGMDNDVNPVSPANYKSVNTISVAATFDYKKLASFSNYGATKVEVAAPGVGIESSIPGNLYLTVSGTSQASPFVANAAGLILDENPSLSNSDVKKILMDTADLKDFLNEKVIAKGIVNTTRSIEAAKLSKTMQLADAIDHARVQINDVSMNKFFDLFNQDQEEGYVIPLPSLFQ